MTRSGSAHVGSERRKLGSAPSGAYELEAVAWDAAGNRAAQGARLVLLAATVEGAQATLQEGPSLAGLAKVVAGGAPRQVDIIRGKSRDRPNGVFIARNVLQAVATAAPRSGRVFVPTLTDLVVLKAWAAVAQTRRAELPRQNRELCLLRSARYADDARRYGAEAQRRGELDIDRIWGLLSVYYTLL